MFIDFSEQNYKLKYIINSNIQTELLNIIHMILWVHVFCDLLPKLSGIINIIENNPFQFLIIIISGTNSTLKFFHSIFYPFNFLNSFWNFTDNFLNTLFFPIKRKNLINRRIQHNTVKLNFALIFIDHCSELMFFGAQKHIIWTIPWTSILI